MDQVGKHRTGRLDILSAINYNKSISERNGKSGWGKEWRYFIFIYLLKK